VFTRATARVADRQLDLNWDFRKHQERQRVATAQHSGTKYNIDFDRTEAIVSIRTYPPHIIREAIEIAKHSHT
jgi:hypothetical protein